MDIKALPYSLEAEREVIGAVMQDNDCLCDVVEILMADDFYKTPHKMLYEAVMGMYMQGIPIDLVTMVNSLGAEKLQSVGGMTYISQLIGGVATTKAVKRHAHIVKEMSERRKIIKSCADALEKAYQGEEDSKGIIGSLEDNLLNIGEFKENSIKTDEEIMNKTINMIDENVQRGGGITGLPTGFYSLDKAIGGLNRGRFVVIAARPAMGKSAFALNIAQEVSETNPVLLFSLEMTDTELGIRRLASKALVNAGKLTNGNLPDEDWQTVMRKASIISTGKMFTDDSAGLTMHDIKARAKKVKLRYGLDVIIIDHIGLIRSTLKSDNKVRQVEEITNGLKIMAKELDVCIIGLSQLSRACEQRSDKRPQLSDLRDSGSIEQDADTVIFLYRDEYYNPETEDKNIVEAIISKNRTGRTGTLKFAWRGEYQKITDLHQ